MLPMDITGYACDHLVFGSALSVIVVGQTLISFCLLSMVFVWLVCNIDDKVSGIRVRLEA